MEGIKIENPQAFPQTWEQNGTTDNWENGMTLRDYFASKSVMTLLCDTDSSRVLTESNDALLNQIVKASYKVADAMLKERLK